MIVCYHFPHIPRRTITRGASRKRHNIAKKCPGPDPVLFFDMESDLVDWVIGIQSQGYPVTRDMILLKGNKIYRGCYGPNRSAVHNGGVDSTELSISPWITTREVARTEILSLPPNIDRTRKRRKTLDVKNRLLTCKNLNKYDD